MNRAEILRACYRGGLSPEIYERSRFVAACERVRIAQRRHYLNMFGFGLGLAPASLIRFAVR